MKPPKHQSLDRNTNIRESLRALLRSPQFSAKEGVCVGCGLTAEFQKVSTLLWETGEAIEIRLPVCQRCAASNNSGRNAPKRSDETVVTPMSNQNWEQVYKFAVLEVDGRKMPERIAAANDAIRGRLREMNGDSDHHEERERLAHALSALKVLAIESQAWL